MSVIEHVAKFLIGQLVPIEESAKNFQNQIPHGAVYIYGNVWDFTSYLPVLFVIGVIGTWMGKKILVHIPQSTFRRISLLLILLIGIITLGAQV